MKRFSELKEKAKGRVDRAKEKFAPLTLRNWGFWIPAQYCQFAFLEEQLQVPFTCVMGLVWNVILSAQAGSATKEEAPAPAPAAAVAPSGPGLLGRIVPTFQQEPASKPGDSEPRRRR